MITTRLYNIGSEILVTFVDDNYLYTNVLLRKDSIGDLNIYDNTNELVQLAGNYLTWDISKENLNVEIPLIDNTLEINNETLEISRATVRTESRREL